MNQKPSGDRLCERSSRAQRWVIPSKARDLLVVLAVIAIVPARPALAQKLFAGTITYQVTPAGGTPVEMIVRSNGKKLREDMRTPGTTDEANSYQMIDGESGDVTVVIPAAKQYMVANFKKLRGGTARGDSGSSRAADMLNDIVATGRKDTIAGISCDVYVRKSQPGNEWCLTTDLGRVGAFDDELTGANAMSSVMKPFRDGAIVLRMSATTASGHPMTMIATKVDRTAPPVSLFKVPPGFLEMTNPMMPKR